MFENPLTQRMFRNRGYDVDMLRKINVDTHDALYNQDEMLAELWRLYQTRQKVVILSDFDMDGIMSGVVGFAGMSELGFNVALFLPDPTEGYGFGISTILRIKKEYPDVAAILTCDVGITAMDGILAAREMGLTVLVTDHHMPEELRLPAADCIVDPYQPGDGYKLKAICGAHVLYQILHAFAERYFHYQPVLVEQIRRLRVFAGIGTISDGMTLLYENRQLVRDAVSIARLLFSNDTDMFVRNIGGCDEYRRAFFGLWSVLDCFAKAGKISKSDDVDEMFFAFYVAPMFNSVKRIGSSDDMANAFGVFFGQDVEEKCEYLYQLNLKRKEMVAQYMDELEKSEQKYAPYVYFSSAPAGILGLLAQKCLVKTGKPCAVLTDDGTIHGSGRAPEWYPFMTRLRKKGFALSGHDVAFGCGFGDMMEVQSFYQTLSEDVAEVEKTVKPEDLVIAPDFVIAHDGSGDTVIDIVLFLEYLSEMEQLHPFGSGFRSPDIELRFMPDEGNWTVIGSNKQHLKVKLAHGFDVLMFNQGGEISREDSHEQCVVRGHLSINEFRGTTTVQFIGELLPAAETAA